MIAKRIEVMEGDRPAQAGEQPQDVDLNDSFEDDLGPNFDDMDDLPNMELLKMLLEQQLSKFPGLWISMHNTRKDMYHCN